MKDAIPNSVTDPRDAAGYGVLNDPSIPAFKKRGRRKERLIGEVVRSVIETGLEANKRPPDRLCECGCGFTVKARFVKGHNRRGQRGASGEYNGYWKGGRGLTTQGYVWVTARDHPSAYNNGTILEHRLVMEQHLGRLLSSEEPVHHENEDKTDNRLENLRLFSSQAEHAAYHAR